MKNLSNSTKKICLCGVGVALYVALSMTIKIPLFGHTSLDLGYIVFAIYCYYFGSIIGATVGTLGCMIISLLVSGWFPIEWMLGNVAIGLIVGQFGAKHECDLKTRIVVVFISVFIGIVIIKTAVACVLYQIPLLVKIPKNLITFIMDGIVMGIGTWIAPKIPIDTINLDLE